MPSEFLSTFVKNWEWDRCILDPSSVAEFISEKVLEGHKWTPGAIFSTIQVLQHEGIPISEIREAFGAKKLRNVVADPFES